MGALVAFGVAVIATPLAALVARKLGILDMPGPLKVHARPVPYLGGAAVFAALAVVLVPSHPSWLVPLGLAFALGVADDVVALPPTLRLLAELVIGGSAGVVAAAPGPLGGAITAVLVVGLINAVNLIDGLDGLAAGIALASAIGFAVLGGGARPLALGLAGGVAGFLVYNRPPARIYLGDGGAYLLGAALAMLGPLELTTNGGGAHWIAIPLLVAMPVADTTIAILRRVRAHRPVLLGDRSHVYDQIVDRGRTKAQAAAWCVAAQALLTAIGVAVWHLPLPWAAAAVAATLLGIVVLVQVLGFIDPRVAP